jgi:hypothetical protein
VTSVVTDSLGFIALRAKKSRASSSKSSTSSSRRPSVEARRKTKTRSSSADAKGVAVDDSASSSSQTRSKRRKIEEVVDGTFLFSLVPRTLADTNACPSDSLSQPSISDEEAIRRLTSDSFASPDSTIRATYKIAGSPGLLKFMDLGERAREYFERITGRGGGTDR